MNIIMRNKYQNYCIVAIEINTQKNKAKHGGNVSQLRGDTYVPELWRQYMEKEVSVLH